MRPTMLMRLPVLCLTVLMALIISQGLSAQTQTTQAKRSDPPAHPTPPVLPPHPTPAPVYNPYPPGFLPADLNMEIDRVTREIDGIENEALAQWRALPINPGTGKRQVEVLGKLEQFDKNLSVNKNMACTFCHMPYTG